MPPYIPSKRKRSASSPTAEDIGDTTRKHASKATNTKSSSRIAAASIPNVDTTLAASSERSGAGTRAGKAAVFHALDAPTKGHTVEENRAFLERGNDTEDSEGSSGSTSDSDEFEDVPLKKTDEAEDSSEWEDALKNPTANSSKSPLSSMPTPAGDLDIVLDVAGNEETKWANAREASGKKGPTKKERQIRIATHCMHVQFLLFHNLVRNSWIQDGEVKRILLSKLNSGCWSEIAQWRSEVGLPPLDRDGTVRKDAPTTSQINGKMKSRKGKGRVNADRPGRDWASTAKNQPGSPTIRPSHDTLPRLLRFLISFWKKTFRVKAHSLRKIGYLSAASLGKHVKGYKKAPNDMEKFGERIESLAEFRECANKCTGSKDVGQQLFTGLLRAIGIEARMVCSLQPVGFGWGKSEDGKMKDSTSVQSDSDDDQRPAASTMTANEDDDSHGGGFIPAKRKNVKGKQRKRSAASSPRGSNRASKITSSDIPTTLDDSSSLSSAPSILDSDIEMLDLEPARTKTRLPKPPPYHQPFPTYWTEAISPTTSLPHAVSPLVAPHIASNAEAFQIFEPRGRDADKVKLVMAYVVAFSSDGTAKDVTVRYIKRRMWPGVTKGRRMPIEKVPIYNKKGKVKKYEEYDWFKTVMSAYARDSRNRTQADVLEDGGDLVPVHPAKRENAAGEDTLQGLKSSAEFVLERHLRREEALLPDAKPVRMFTSGKGEKAKEEPVYRRQDIVTCKTVESWHKEGRELIPGSQPLKHVPMRAVTLIRKREIEESERETGEKKMQGLYSKDQTTWIIPPPIKNGVIPRNAFGNIDVYVPSMIPKGAVHIARKGTAKLCKKLGIDFAEACTGFEFGKQRAVPVLTGVVVAAENKNLVIDAWRTDQEIQRRKDDAKRQALALKLWKKFFNGLRIVQRVKAEYGEESIGGDGETNPFINKRGRDTVSENNHSDDHDLLDLQNREEDMAGGFFVPGHEEEFAGNLLRQTSNNEKEEGGGFIIEDEDMETTTPSTTAEGPMRPISLQSLHRKSLIDTDGDASSSINYESLAGDDQEDEMNNCTDRRRRSGKPTPKSKKNLPHKPGRRKALRSSNNTTKRTGLEIDGANEEEEIDEPSGLSELSEVSSFDSEASVKRGRGARKKNMPKETTASRKMPARRAATEARVGNRNGTRSKYFEASDADVGDDE